MIDPKLIGLNNKVLRDTEASVLRATPTQNKSCGYALWITAMLSVYL